MEFEQILSAATDMCFPMLLSWYLLIRMEEKLDKLSSNIEALSRTIAVQGAK